MLFRSVLVSDFYTPNYFDPVKAPGVRYSFTGAITEPRTVLKGGYLSWQDPVSGNWWQEIWFDAEADFRDLGAIDAMAEGNMRAAIDRVTSIQTLKVISAGRHSARAVGVCAASNHDSTAARASVWREQIAEILGMKEQFAAPRVSKKSRRAPSVY